jgi:hypothetical protein
MSDEMDKTKEKEPMTVNEPVVSYQTTRAKTSLSDNSWDPNVPFCGTQEEWWEHFHRIEEGEFTPWEEHQKKFETWKTKYLASRIV